MNPNDSNITKADARRGHDMFNDANMSQGPAPEDRVDEVSNNARIDIDGSPAAKSEGTGGKELILSEPTASSLSNHGDGHPSDIDVDVDANMASVKGDNSDSHSLCGEDVEDEDAEDEDEEEGCEEDDELEMDLGHLLLILGKDVNLSTSLRTIINIIGDAYECEKKKGSTLEAEIEMKDVYIGTLQRMISEQEMKESGFNGDIAHKEDELASLRVAFKEMKLKYEASEGERRTLQAEHEQLSSVYRLCLKGAAEQSNKIAEYKNKLVAAEEATAEAKEELNAEYRELEKRFHDLDRDHKDLQAAAAGYEKEWQVVVDRERAKVVKKDAMIEILTQTLNKNGVIDNGAPPSSPNDSPPPTINTKRRARGTTQAGKSTRREQPPRSAYKK